MTHKAVERDARREAAGGRHARGAGGETQNRAREESEGATAGGREHHYVTYIRNIKQLDNQSAGLEARGGRAWRAMNLGLAPSWMASLRVDCFVP